MFTTTNTALQAAMERVRALPTRGHTPEAIARIKATARITPAARWDCATREERELLNPALNPNKRWFEQQAWKILT